MTRMQRLTLRNCLLIGSIPGFIGQMPSLKNLDLSFNRLNGPIPNQIKTIDFDAMFLNNNPLSGDIPQWIFQKNTNVKIDLSYNNFTSISSPQICQSSSWNLVSSLSSSASNNTDAWCLTDKLTCSRNLDRHSLFINCGGPALDFEGKEYEADSADQGSYFHSSDEIWAYSTNGVFTGNDDAPFIATTTNVRGGDIYRTTRLSPASLRYYGQLTTVCNMVEFFSSMIPNCNMANLPPFLSTTAPPFDYKAYKASQASSQSRADDNEEDSDDDEDD